MTPAVHGRYVWVDVSSLLRTGAVVCGGSIIFSLFLLRTAGRCLFLSGQRLLEERHVDEMRKGFSAETRGPGAGATEVVGGE